MSIPEALLLSLLLGLGTARMSAIISIDTITAPLRDLVFHYFPPEDNDREGWYYQSLRPATDAEKLKQDEWDSPWWKKRFAPATEVEHVRDPSFIGQLISCQKCVGVWIAAANVAAFYIWRDGTIVFNLFLAASFVSAAANERYYR